MRVAGVHAASWRSPLHLLLPSESVRAAHWGAAHHGQRLSSWSGQQALRAYASGYVTEL